MKLVFQYIHKDVQGFNRVLKRILSGYKVFPKYYICSIKDHFNHFLQNIQSTNYDLIQYENLSIKINNLKEL